MKKFWNLMLAALVIFGAVACTENQEENIPEAKKEPVLSFVANIANDETRTHIEKDGNVWKTEWDGNETLYVEDYVFTNSVDEKSVFNCYDNGVLELIGQPVQISNNYYGIDSTTGQAGAYLNGYQEEFDPTTTITLEVQSAFFHFTSAHEVTLKASKCIFGDEDIAENGYVDTITFSAGEHWVAFLPEEGNVTFSYSVDGYKVKQIEKDFEAKKIYNLGELVAAEPYDFIGIVGGHQGWDTANKDAMYLIPGSNTYVRYNVPITAEGFKFYGEKEADYYLVPNSNWNQANARFAIYFYGNGETWVSMEDKNGDGIYVANKPTDGKKYPNMIFCRMNPSTTENKWENKWNQTGNLDCPTDSNNCYTINNGSWDTGTWGVRKPEVKEITTTYWFGKEDSNKDISKWVTRWSNNGGPKNITVSDTNKTYDIYFHKGNDADWGFEVHYVVLESGSEAPVLK